jgi:hypothetical protein
LVCRSDLGSELGLGLGLGRGPGWAAGVGARGLDGGLGL